MSGEIREDLQQQVAELWRNAHDYDRNDPLFGLNKEDLCGPKLSRRSMLRLLAAAGTLTVAHVAAACARVVPTTTGPSTGASEAMPSALVGGELTAGWPGNEITTLDPAQIYGTGQFQIASNIMSGLTHINAELIAEGDLAHNWEVSDNGLEWTFFLRQGVKWHNGDDFTADDVVFTYNRSKDPDQSIHSAVLANVADVLKVDDYTVKIILARPQASLLVKTLERASGRAMTMVNQRALAEMGPEQYGLMPVGTGPFRVIEHQLGQGVIVERFPDFWDSKRPKLDKITFLPIPEPETLAAAIEAGDIQIILGSPAAELIDRFAENPDLVVSEVMGPNFEALWLNPHREPLRVENFNKSVEELKQEPDFMVRLAIAKAIDRDEFIERARFGRGEPAYGSINPAMGFFYDLRINETSEQRFDLEAARQLLADAGFPDGQGFPTLQLMITPAARREGEILVNMLKNNLNIDVELDIKDNTVLVEHYLRMDFDMLRLGSGGDYDPDDALVDIMTTTSRLNGLDRPDDMPFGFFSDAEVDALVVQEQVETDLEKRKELVQRANKLTSDKVAVAFLFHEPDMLVYRTEVNYPDVGRIPGFVDLDRVTIEQ